MRSGSVNQAAVSRAGEVAKRIVCEVEPGLIPQQSGEVLWERYARGGLVAIQNLGL